MYARQVRGFLTYVNYPTCYPLRGLAEGSEWDWEPNAAVVGARFRGYIATWVAGGCKGWRRLRGAGVECE